MSIKKIGVLTSGGDTPGMNAAIRAVVKTVIGNGIKARGIRKGYAGLIDGDIIHLHNEDVETIINRGGTFLTTARSSIFRTDEGLGQALKVIDAYKLDGIVAIGGDGTLSGARDLARLGVPVMGLPGTIDNDLPYTDFTIGFDTAVNNVIGEIYKIRDTMQSHNRNGIIEVMGNNCGDIALHAGIGGAAEHILVPEVPFDRDELCERLSASKIKGTMTSIVVIAEGAGDSNRLAGYIASKTGLECKAIVLGYIQRGGQPSGADMLLATRTGIRAVELFLEGKKNRAVGIRENQIIDMDLDEALDTPSRFDRALYDSATNLMVD